MEEKLDSFIPPLEVLNAIRRQLINAGIGPEGIPEDWLVAIAAATNMAISKDQIVQKFVVERMRMKWKRGEDNKEYEYYHPENGEVYPVSPEKVTYYWGAAVFGKPVDPELVTSMNKTTVPCDGCGVSVYCSKEVASNGKILTLCRACLLQSEHRAEANDTCNNCTLTSCVHNPKRIK